MSASGTKLTVKDVCSLVRRRVISGQQMLKTSFSASDPFPTLGAPPFAVATSATISRAVVPRGHKVGLVLPQTYAGGARARYIRYWGRFARRRSMM